jgi:hypothetical protein
VARESQKGGRGTGFQAGRTAKPRQRPPCAVTPRKRTWPPARHHRSMAVMPQGYFLQTFVRNLRTPMPGWTNGLRIPVTAFIVQVDSFRVTRSLLTPERLVATFCMLPTRSVPKLQQHDRSSRRRQFRKHGRWLDSHDSAVAPALGVSDLNLTRVGAVSICLDRCFVPTPRRVRTGEQPAILNLLRTTNAARSKRPQLSDGTSNKARRARNHVPTKYLEAQHNLAAQPASAFPIQRRCLHGPANSSCLEDE